MAQVTAQEDPGLDLDALAVAAPTSSQALENLLVVVHRDHLATRAIHRLVIDHHDVEEIEQDVLIAVARSIGSFRAEARFTTWLYALARNVAIDFLRRRRETIERGEFEEGPGSAGTRLSSMIATRHVLRDAVDALPERYREAVVLRDVERLSYEEVAQRLELNLNTAKSRISRGRAMLAGSLGNRVSLGEPVDAEGDDGLGDG